MEENCDERRARLQALRVEAESASPPTPPPSQLSNPLLRPPEPETSPPSSRFGYYTNPMAAFSFSKRKRPFQPSDGGFSSSPGSRPPFSPYSVGQWGYQMTPFNAPASQFHLNQSSHCGSPVPGPFVGDQWRSPVQQWSPHRAPPFTSSHHTAGSSGRSYFSGDRSGRGGSSISTRARSGFHSNNSGRGQGPRGRGWNSGGRGWGGGVSARQEAGQLYSKSMVKDPWRKLKPVVGNILVPRADSSSLHLKSFAGEKGKRTECGNPLRSQSSLAEFLAASLEDVNDEPEAPT